MKTVNKTVKGILNHIKSCYPKGEIPVYTDWYVGVTDKTTRRYKAHAKNYKLTSLPDYKKFYSFSMSNARAVESKLCEQFKMDANNTHGGIYIYSKYNYVFNKKKAKIGGAL